MSWKKNLSPAMVRELKRHVSPNANKPSSAPKDSSYVLYVCVGLTVTAASFPLLAHWWISAKDSLANRDQALTSAQIRRGAFLNSGSKDIGRDPAWDAKTGTYQKDAGYYAIFQDEQRSKLPGAFHAMPPTHPQNQQHLIDFATGKVKQNGQPTPYRSTEGK
jgi:hypothetical protein